MRDVDGPNGRARWERADTVLPGGGIYATRSADFAGRGVLPGFIASAEGCRVTDVDGRTYLDLLGANGPNLLGYRHPEVEAAADAQRARQVAASLFPDVLVDVVETLTERFAYDWGVVAKNGSDVMSLGTRVARQDTGRLGLVAFEQAYHGNAAELAGTLRPGPLADLTRDVVRLPWNDPQALVDHCAVHGDQLAAVVVNPIDQNPRQPTVDPTDEFVAAIADVRDRHGLLVVMDDVRHGFRLHPDGSSHRMGLVPDLVAFGKALGNGHSIAALLGREPQRRAARRILYTATPMFEAAPMAAAIATVAIYDRDHAFDHLEAMGTRLVDGLRAAAARAGVGVSITGPPAMPTLLFEDDPDGERQRAFARSAAQRGAILHPSLNWNLSAAHRAADIDEIVDIAAESFAETPPSS